MSLSYLWRVLSVSDRRIEDLDVVLHGVELHQVEAPGLQVADQEREEEGAEVLHVCEPLLIMLVMK